MRRAILAFAPLIALSQTAKAGVPLFGHVSCAVVRFYVAKYSEAAAETWARSHGAGDAEIETARRCLHSANVQTASWAARSQVLAPVPAQEHAKHEPDPDQVALHVVSVQGQRAEPEQKKLESEPAAHGFIRAKYIEDGSAEHVTSRPTYVGAMHRAHRAGHVSWLKRLWANLTGRRQFRVAFLHFSGRRQ